MNPEDILNYFQKLKPLNEWWVGLVYIGNGVLLLIFAILGYWKFYLTFLGILLCAVALLNVIVALRTKNWASLVGALHYTVIASMLFVLPGGNKALLGALIGIFCFTLFWNISIFSTKKTKWRRREVFELAAHPVEDVTNGFTNRPKPAGLANYTREDILAFAHFVFKKFIAIPYIEKDKAVLIITKNRLRHLLNIKNEYADETYISFTFDGKVVVNITKADYLQYKDALSFDQLCESMGRLFSEFLELHKKGEAVRIIDRMNSLKLSPFEGIMLF